MGNHREESEDLKNCLLLSNKNRKYQKMNKNGVDNRKVFWYIDKAVSCSSTKLKITTTKSCKKIKNVVDK